jgi:Ca-activated chloride channel family protein
MSNKRLQEQVMKSRFRITLFNTVLALMLLGIDAPASSTAQVQLKIEAGQEALLAGSTQRLFIKVGLEGIAPPKDQERAPINVALVLDRSGSMSGEKIENARQAALAALEYLNNRDTIALVTYDDKVDVPFAAAQLENKAAVQRAIRKIDTGGMTALFAGVSEGANQLKRFLDRERINRIVLISDGLANVGPDTPEELGSLGRKLAQKRISISTIGLGLRYNEDLMMRLADASDGNHAFVEDAEQLAGIFRKEFGELGTVVAQAATVIIQCEEGVRPIRILGREGRINGNKVEANIQQLYAAQERYLLLEVEITPGTVDSKREVARVNLDYDDLAANTRANASGVVQISYTAAREQAEKTVNKAVMVDATTQIGVEMDDEAITHKDKGNTEEARAVFSRKAAFLREQAARYDSATLREQAALTKKAEAAVTDDTETWNIGRKATRSIQMYYKKGQSYR